MSVDIEIIVAKWEEHLESILFVRREVFIIEQNIPVALDLDGEDESSVHVLARTIDNKVPVGTARLMQDGRIGRVAVLSSYRKAGIGSQLMKLLLIEAEKKACDEIYLHAQTVSLAFYEKLGFQPVGEEFDEAGIPHFEMRRPKKSRPDKRGG